MRQSLDIKNEIGKTNIPYVGILDATFNSIFSTNSKAGNFRFIVLQILFYSTWILCAFTFHQPGEIDYPWLDFLYILPFPIMETIVNLIELFLAWDVLLVVLSLYIGYKISLTFASIYLADIFEIKDQSISEKYLKQSAFTFPIYYQIHVENAQVRPADQSSPIFRIGGPGKVIINIENAVVFEKINGTPRISGTTIEKPIELESFERVRKIIDLRDQSANLSIAARTLDGIPIEIKDIRLIFSVFRNTKLSTIEKPYPFSEDAIFWLVYQQDTNPWTTTLVDLVRTDLISYINHHLLSELFSSASPKDINLHIQYQKHMDYRIRLNLAHTRRYKIKRELLPIRKKDAPNNKPIYYKKIHSKKLITTKYFNKKSTNMPEFVPRTSLSNLFYENVTSSFHSKAQKIGMKLEWINVGTWYSPSNIVPEQFMTAWKISSENKLKLDPQVLFGIFTQSRKQHLAQTIKSTPIISFILKRESGKSNTEIVNELINEYSAKLWGAKELYLKKKGRVPIQIERSLQQIRNFQINHIKEQAIFLTDNDSQSTNNFEDEVNGQE